MDLEHYSNGASSPHRDSLFMKRLGVRRRRMAGYHRLHNPAGARRPKLKVARLGGVGGGRRKRGRCAVSKFIKASQKWWRNNVNMLSTFHRAYVQMMMKLAAQLRKECRVLGGKKVAGRNQIWDLPGGERIDDRVLVEFCNRLVMMTPSADHDHQA